MKTNPLLKLIELDKKLNLLEERGKAIRQPFNEMMKRKQMHLSFLMAMRNDPAADPEQVKKEIKELEKFLEFYSLSLTSWDFSNNHRDEFYQQWTLRDVLRIENNQKRRAFLNYFPDMKETLHAILEALENLIVIQRVIIIRLEESVEADKESRICTDAMLMNMN